MLFDLSLEDLPKVGSRKAERLRRYGIETVRAYYEASLSRIRAAFGSVDGDRIWLAMHGHDVRWTKRTTPASMSHSRVLDPTRRSESEPVARWLALCGWLRARSAGLRARTVRLEGKVGDRLYVLQCRIQHPGSEREILGAVSAAWRALRERCLPERITVILDELSPDPWGHVDLLEGTNTFDGPLDSCDCQHPGAVRRPCDPSWGNGRSDGTLHRAQDCVRADTDAGGSRSICGGGASVTR